MNEIESVKALATAGNSPGPWQFGKYTKANGEPIQTVEDVAETTASSAYHSNKAELWGVSLPGDDGPVICYTGNGPTSEANARFIASAPDMAIEILRLTTELAAAHARIVELQGKA